jgi:hypothetical protein
LDDDLLFGSAEFIADLLGCSVRTARRYKSGATSLPEPCRRLLRLRQCGDLSALLGKEWEGFKVGKRDDLLYVPLFRNGLGPRQMSAMFFGYQELAAHRVEVKRLQSAVWALQKVAMIGRTQAVQSSILRP